MPNLIHSLDATSLILLINDYFTNYDSEHKNIYAVHDCFAVTCKNVDYLIESLKMIYISLYADKGYLTKLNNEIITHIKSHVGDDFDLKTFRITLTNKKTIQFPNIDNVLKEKYDITLLKNSSYIIN
ncbi:hypothetical protein CPB85DRAFT_158204 [Mucidula mucida]|nr:hypothetical protein CPB85DRAFT_158204 [Mucidula mucida]